MNPVTSPLRQQGRCNYTSELMKARRTWHSYILLFAETCESEQTHIVLWAPGPSDDSFTSDSLNPPEMKGAAAGRMCLFCMDVKLWHRLMKKWKTSRRHIKYLPTLVLPPFTRWKIGSHAKWLTFFTFFLFRFVREAHTLKWTHTRRPSGFGCCFQSAFRFELLISSQYRLTVVLQLYIFPFLTSTKNITMIMKVD